MTKPTKHDEKENKKAIKEMKKIRVLGKRLPFCPGHPKSFCQSCIDKHKRMELICENK